MAPLTTFASAEKSDLFGVLGIDLKLLILQSIAFLIMLWVLKKFVYPPLTRALDERQKTVEEGLRAAKEAEENAAKSQAEIEKILATARKEANGIIATAKSEAVASIEAAEAKAKTKAQRIVEQAHEQLDQDVREARKTLRKDTVELVTLATEKVLAAKLDAVQDAKLVETAIKEML